MEDEKHKKADEIRAKIKAIKEELGKVAYADENCSAVFIGYNGNGAHFEGDRKTMFIQQVKAILNGDLAALEKEYSEI